MDDTHDSDRRTELTDRRHQATAREACVSRGPEGDPIGAAVFLTADDLREIGIDPTTADAVTVSVEDGEVRLLDTAAPETTEGGR